MKPMRHSQPSKYRNTLNIELQRRLELQFRFAVLALLLAMTVALLTPVIGLQAKRGMGDFIFLKGAE
jgi:hypothetical protein